jgi:hypothetical protein
VGQDTTTDDEIEYRFPKRKIGHITPQ